MNLELKFKHLQDLVAGAAHGLSESADTEERDSMISGKSHAVPRFCRFWALVQDPADVVWARGGGCSTVGKMEQIRVKVEQIQALRGLQKHLRHFVFKAAASASKCQ